MKRNVIQLFVSNIRLTFTSFQYSEQNTTFRKLDLFPPSDEKVRSSYLLGSDRVNLSPR
jgi:hypothetical protein